MRRNYILWGLLAMMVFPECARADSVTPMVAASWVHLLVGNLIIGIGEGLLLSAWIKISRRDCIEPMIVANYFSTCVGFLFFQLFLIRQLPVDLNNARGWFWFCVVLAYFVTVVLEWPFIARLVDRSQKGWFWRSVKVAFGIHAASYVVLIVGYGVILMVSIDTKAEVVKPETLPMSPSVFVYYLGPDGDVYKQSLSKGMEKKVASLGSHLRNDRLYMATNEANPTHWDLWARLDTGDDKKPGLRKILSDLPVVSVADRYLDKESAKPKGNSGAYGSVLVLGSVTNSPWKVWVGRSDMEGIHCVNENNKASYRFVLETFLGAWRFRNAVLLPSDQVLFQLGDNQICVLDLPTKRVALLCHGRGPVAVIEKH